MTETQTTLIINAMTDEIEDYAPEFKKEYGIIDMIEIGQDFGGYITYQLTFDSEDNKTNYIETFDIPVD
ncbi:MAG: hypothetical protein ACO3QM_06445 [Candidatus Nanopelagicaceae bacterium]|jgi:hypothetical protein